AKGIPTPLYDVVAGRPNRAASMSRAMTKKSPPSLSGNGEAKMKLARTMNATASAEATSTAYVRRETSPASAAEPVGDGASNASAGLRTRSATAHPPVGYRPRPDRAAAGQRKPPAPPRWPDCTVRRLWAVAGGNCKETPNGLSRNPYSPPRL